METLSVIDQNSFLNVKCIQINDLRYEKTLQIELDPSELFWTLWHLFEADPQQSILIYGDRHASILTNHRSDFVLL